MLRFCFFLFPAIRKIKMYLNLFSGYIVLLRYVKELHGVFYNSKYT